MIKRYMAPAPRQADLSLMRRVRRRDTLSNQVFDSQLESGARDRQDDATPRKIAPLGRSEQLKSNPLDL
jgi:hypothetical protein